jgi:hypothetical protein
MTASKTFSLGIGSPAERLEVNPSLANMLGALQVQDVEGLTVILVWIVGRDQMTVLMKGAARLQAPGVMECTEKRCKNRCKKAF